MKHNCKKTWFLLKYMEQQCSNGISSNRAKFMHLIKAYNEEVRVLRHDIAKSKDKEKRALMKPLALMEKHVPKELFKLMLYRSKILHSLAFF